VFSSSLPIPLSLSCDAGLCILALEEGTGVASEAGLPLLLRSIGSVLSCPLDGESGPHGWRPHAPRRSVVVAASSPRSRSSRLVSPPSTRRVEPQDDVNQRTGAPVAAQRRRTAPCAASRRLASSSRRRHRSRCVPPPSLHPQTQRKADSLALTPAAPVEPQPKPVQRRTWLNPRPRQVPVVDRLSKLPLELVYLVRPLSSFSE